MRLLLQRLHFWVEILLIQGLLRLGATQTYMYGSGYSRFLTSLGVFSAPWKADLGVL